MPELIRRCCKCKKIGPHTVRAGYCKKCRSKTKREKYHNDPIYREYELTQSGIRQKAKHITTKIWKDNYLSNHPCVDCNNKDIRVLEFHHRNPQEKKFIIGEASSHNFESIMKEVEKCDVLCSNCHNIKHYYDEHRGRVPKK